MRRLALCLGLTALAAAVPAVLGAAKALSDEDAAPKRRVLVELFTSQG